LIFFFSIEELVRVQLLYDEGSCWAKLAGILLLLERRRFWIE